MNIRQRIARWLAPDAFVEKVIELTPAELYQKRKAEVYGALRGLTVADSLLMLGEIQADLVGPHITSTVDVQVKMQAISDLAGEMTADNFMFLLASALTAFIRQRLPVYQRTGQGLDK